MLKIEPNIFITIKNKLLEQGFLKNNPHILVGFSGGPDSMFLALFLVWLKDQNLITLNAAHFDHGWRAESASEATFCKNFCRTNGIPFFLGESKDFIDSIKANGSKEELGRLMRREFFIKIKNDIGANFVALAHHSQDQEETFFIRLLRGSSLSGLTCMKIISECKNYLRPLLDVSKHQILEYLKENNIQFLTDPTNSSDDFLRNRIRNHVIPALTKADSRFNQKFKDTLFALQEEESLLKEITNSKFDEIFENGNGSVKLFREANPSLQKRLLIKLFCQQRAHFKPSRPFLDEAIKFISSPRGGSHCMSKSWKLVKSKDKFNISL
jgi:tRNA(Ile)-lysidine synthase